MKLLRRTLTTLGLVFGAIALVAGLLWFKNPDIIGADIQRHVDKVLRGEADVLNNRTPGQVIRYLMFRLEGHNNLQTLALPALRWVQASYERPVPTIELPTLGKGQQTTSLPPMQYDVVGRPVEAVIVLTPSSKPELPNQICVDSAQSLLKATESAQPGQTIVIAPGRYLMNSRINTSTPGTPDHPITVRAAQPGQVTLDFNTQVAFRVYQPYWVFENIHIRGTCKADSACEHAFHIYGAAKNTVVRNNLIEDFNASIKINGSGQDWPDFGLIQYNTLQNTRNRVTANPVTLIDLVGANQWRVSDNVIRNFVKVDGTANGVSYGVFMKGASSGGRIERNVVICTPYDISQPGVRVGISFGGGTTGQAFCRDQRCDAEHTAGLAANNVVAHCNDFGIDVNRSRGVLIAHNTLINTAGIDVRQATSSARLYGNLLEGYVRQIGAGEAKSEMNSISTLVNVFQQPDRLQLGWRTASELIPSLPMVPIDFYGRARQEGTAIGAFASSDSAPKK